MHIRTSDPSSIYHRPEKAERQAEESSAMANFSTVFQQLAQAQSRQANTSDEAEAANPFGIETPAGQKAAFRSWLESRQSAGVGAEYLGNLSRQADAFEVLIDKAHQAGAYHDPKAFVLGLSSEERATLQQIHNIAEPIAPGRLTQEGALNLLLSPNQRKDIDKDGFVMVGEAKTWVFPPVDAPPEVKAAWDKAVAESDKSELLLQTAFMPPPFQENVYLGQDVNTYLDLISQRLSGAKESLKSDYEWQKEDRRKQIAFLTRFLEILEGN